MLKTKQINNHRCKFEYYGESIIYNTINPDSKKEEAENYFLPIVKNKVKNKINEWVEKQQKVVEEKYPQFEIATWDIQKQEYYAYLQNKDVVLTFIPHLAEELGVSVDTYMLKVGDKIKTIATLLSLYKQAKAQLNSIETLADLDTFIQNYSDKMSL